MDAKLHITGDAEADGLLSKDPLALLVGMLLDQQIAMETAFEGPKKIRERLAAAGGNEGGSQGGSRSGSGGSTVQPAFDAETLAAYDPDALVGLFRETPAVHRYPGSMAGRVQSLCQALVESWDGDATELWTRDDPDGKTLLKRLESLPGFGAQKARIFVALLGKQYGVTPSGWREAAGPYGEEGSYRSVADIVDADSLTRVRETKRAAKAAAKDAKK